MITHVTQSEFIDTFKQSHSYKTNFSYDGLVALFEYLEELEDSTGENIEFDYIAICCDYSEYKNLDEFIINYQDYEHIKNWPTKAAYDNLILALRDQTEVIEFKGRTTEAFVGNISKPDNSFIIRAF